MKQIIKIIPSVPCYVTINNENFFIEKSKYFELIDEDKVFIECNPCNSDYLSINYLLSDKKVYSKNVRITSYKAGKVIELLFTNSFKVKEFEYKGIKINYFNGYRLFYNNHVIELKSFSKNYFKFDCEELNKNYMLIKGFFYLNENKPDSHLNQKISVAVLDMVNSQVIHSDICNKTEVKDGVLKIITLLYDQNSQALISEFNVAGSSFLKNDFYSVYTNKTTKKLHHNFQIARAFFECIQADNKKLIASYLSDDINQKINNKDLHLMFNNFVKIDNEFLTSTNYINIISKVSDNFYEAQTYNVQFSGGKITNIVSVNEIV